MHLGMVAVCWRASPRTAVPGPLEGCRCAESKGAEKPSAITSSTAPGGSQDLRLIYPTGRADYPRCSAVVCSDDRNEIIPGEASRSAWSSPNALGLSASPGVYRTTAPCQNSMSTSPTHSSTAPSAFWRSASLRRCGSCASDRRLSCSGDRFGAFHPSANVVLDHGTQVPKMRLPRYTWQVRTFAFHAARCA